MKKFIVAILLVAGLVFTAAPAVAQAQTQNLAQSNQQLIALLIQLINQLRVQILVLQQQGAATVSGSGLTASMILNSNGFVDGQKRDPVTGRSPQTINRQSIVYGDLDSDGSNEAAAIIVSCGASCGRRVSIFRLVNGSVVQLEAPQSNVAGAAQNIEPLQVSKGILTATVSDNEGTKTLRYRLINGVMTLFNPSVGMLGGITLDNLKSMYVDYGYGGRLSNGQYLSSVIDCTGVRGTCPGGQRLYLGLDSNTIVRGDFNDSIDDDAAPDDVVVGIRYGYINGNDDLITAPADATGEFLALVELINNQPTIVDKLYASSYSMWKRINQVNLQGANLIVDATDSNQGRFIYTIRITNNRFVIVSVYPYAIG